VIDWRIGIARMVAISITPQDCTLAKLVLMPEEDFVALA
jgi:hypothetical protein